VTDVKNGLNLFPYCPIVVNPELMIMDGQHRFIACKELELPVFYVIADNIKLRDIARMNSNTDKWKPNDFLMCYIQLGSKDYEILREFSETRKVPLTTAIFLLN